MHRKEFGLSPTMLSMMKLSPAMDEFMTRPADVCYGEYGGQSKQAHIMLFDVILFRSGKERVPCLFLVVEHPFQLG